jgi:glycosyltransferase involved in cell wall biosynthesis
MTTGKISIAVPFRTDYYSAYARLLYDKGKLRSSILWTRKSFLGTPSEDFKSIPILGLAAFAGAKTLSPYHAEAFRFALYPLFDAWARRHLLPGDHLISSYAYANRCFRWVRKHGGKTFLDGGNSHPQNFWDIISEEHRRWNCPYPPVPKWYLKRALETVEETDYVLSPSRFVSESFLQRGFGPDQIIPVVYPQNLDLFKPSEEPRPKDRPFTMISTGGLSLRKGTPYLLEAFRLLRKRIPDARLLLTDSKTSSILPILEKYRDLPIEWAPYLGHDLLAKRLQGADIFVLPSLEEGLVRTAIQAMSCGLPVILTPNTGASDYVVEGVNGSIIPIRDSGAIVEKALFWHEKIGAGGIIDSSDLHSNFSMKALRQKMVPMLSLLGRVPVMPDER